MTQHPDLFAALAAPFDPQEVRTRMQGGRTLSYITARTAMNRLTIRLPDGSTLTKADAGGYAGMADQGDDDKSGYSDAFKRAAVKFGVARYLYRDGVPGFVRERHPASAGQAAVAASSQVQAAHPARPAAEPASGDNGIHQAQAPSPSRGERPARPEGAPPRTGKALFAWTKDQETRHEVGLLKYLNGWAKLQEFPGRMVDWDAEQVQAAYAEAVRKLQGYQAGRDEAYEEALAN